MCRGEAGLADGDELVGWDGLGRDAEDGAERGEGLGSGGAEVVEEGGVFGLGLDGVHVSPPVVPLLGESTLVFGVCKVLCEIFVWYPEGA